MWLYHLTVTLKPLLRVYWRFRFTGATDSIPAGPLLVAANHSSFLDPWFLAMVIPRPLHYLITRNWYDRSALWRGFFRANGTIPVQEQDLEATLRTLSEVLDRGEAVCIFPEGRISHDGRIQRFRSGLARIAARTGAPVLPVGIQGAYDSLPRHRRFPKPGAITVRVGQALRFPGSPRPDAPRMQELLAFRDRLFHEVQGLAGQREA